MPCKKQLGHFGLWAALAVGITAASMSAGKKDTRHHAAGASSATPRVSLTLPLN